MRKFEKIQKEKGDAKNYAAESEVMAELPEEEDNLEDYVYLGERDLEEIFEKEELTEALGSYQQWRKIIREQKKKGKSQSKGGGSSRLSVAAGGASSDLIQRVL